MSRDYGRVYTAFWNSQDIRSRSDKGKLLANYLVTGPHSNAIGAYLLPDAYIADDLGWSMETVRETLSELFEIGFARRFEDGRHIVICKFLQWNPIENPNVGKAAIKQLDQLPDDEAIQCVIDGLMLYEKHFPNGFGRVSEQSRNKEPKPEPIPKPEPKPEAAATQAETSNQIHRLNAVLRFSETDFVRHADNIRTLVELKTEGCDFEKHILPAAEQAARGGKAKSLAYIAPRARELRDAAAKVASMPAPFENTDERGWRDRLAQFRKDGGWVPKWGPKPGEPGCKCPAPILEQAA
jgi:hypothetical protein